MTSEAPQRLFVWIWLPGRAAPVVAGALDPSGFRRQEQDVLLFTYARSYLAIPEAIALFPPELPLQAGTFDPTSPVGRRSPLALHSCLRDAAPDAWGRRMLNARFAGEPEADLSEMTYLVSSGSDRIGALDFQLSATEYVARDDDATLEQLLRAAELLEAGQPIPQALAAAALHGTSVGGARPKALLRDGDVRMIAKFASATDTRPVVKAEAVAMLLAAAVGIDVAPARVEVVNGKDVLLAQRFDRPMGGGRRHLVSSLTILGLGEMESRHSSYADLARAIRTGAWSDPRQALRQMFMRLVFNVCIGNTDDHLRNHSAFWDGKHLRLTPAYDLSPQPRSSQTASHAIGITADGQRASQLRLCLAVAPEFHLRASEAQDLIDHTVSTITSAWQEACDEAQLTSVERQGLLGREFLNPYIFYGAA